jgi:MtN3 and saliva related transmembrane protein
MLKEIIAILATLCVTVSYIPQIIRGYRRKSLKDVSMGFLVIIAAGVSFWIVYALLDKDLTFLLANIIILLCAIVLIIMKVHYQKGKS